MAEPTDHILLELSDGVWGYRYVPAPTAEDGNDLFGVTVCCNRIIAVSRGLHADALGAAARQNFPRILDCCEKSGVPAPVELPPYSGEHATCRKCGSKAVETKFTTQAQQPFGLPPSAGYPAEWLHRCCVVCSAEWNEATIQPEPECISYGLFRSGARTAQPHAHPYLKVGATNMGDALDSLLSGHRLPLDAGTELVCRQKPGDAWTLLCTVSQRGDWVMADG